MIQFLEKGSSLIPRSWPRVAASGGWGVLITAICDNQRIAVIGTFFGGVTVDIGHQLFCGADSVHIGACVNYKLFWRLWRGVTLPIWKSKMSESDPTASMPLAYWTGVTVAFHTCGWCDPRDSAWREQEASLVSPLSTRITRVNGKMSVRIPWPRWVATPSLRKRRLPSRWRSGIKLLKFRHRVPVEDSNPLSVPCWLQVASLPDPQNAGGRRQNRSEKTNKTTMEKHAEVCRWKVVTASVLTFQPAVEKVAAGYRASGGRLEFEKRTADL